MKSAKYPNLYLKAGRKGWVFRKYSAAKRKEFVFYTKEDREADAYQKGRREFDRWMASVMPTGRETTIRDIAKAIVAEGAGRDSTVRLKARRLMKYVVPVFGRMKPSEVNQGAWLRYDQAERRKGRTSLFNDRKHLIECLHRAKDAKLIDSVPRLQRLDPEAEPPREISPAEYRRIRRAISKRTKLMIFVMYWQGARPGEILKYRWDMVDLARGIINIPGAITKTKRGRSIPLHRNVWRALRLVRRQHPAQTHIFPGKCDRGPQASYWTVWDNGMTRLEEAGTPCSCSVYNFRDTYITRQIRKGKHTTVIAKYCDTSAKEIEKRYAAIDENMLRELD